MQKRLSRRDYVLLPGISLLTILVILGVAEAVARQAFPDGIADSCFYSSPEGPRDRVNCTSYERIPESPVIKNTFDACGYRSIHGCGPKRPGTFRVVVLGSSVAEAHLVPQNESYMALAPSRYDVIPLAAPLASPVHSLLRIDEAVALHPDAVIQMLSPIDIELLWLFLNGQQHAKATHDWNKILYDLQSGLKDSRSVLAAEHFLFKDEDAFLRLYMLYGYKADFMRPPFSTPWQTRFRELEGIDAKIAKRLHAAGIPFYLMAVPSRADAVLMRRSQDAFAWGQAVNRVADAVGSRYIDALHEFAKTRHPGDLFYTVDGHMNAAAQPFLEHAIVEALDCDQDGAR